MRYTLVDGELQNKLTPETFGIPTKEEVEGIKDGDYVKVGFEEEGKQTERMWVQVTSIQDSVFAGILDNDPVQLDTVKYRDVVTFEAKHILSILYN